MKYICKSCFMISVFLLTTLGRANALQPGKGFLFTEHSASGTKAAADAGPDSFLVQFVPFVSPGPVAQQNVDFGGDHPDLFYTVPKQGGSTPESEYLKIPEPSSLVLMLLLGGAAYLGLRRR